MKSLLLLNITLSLPPLLLAQNQAEIAGLLGQEDGGKYIQEQIAVATPKDRDKFLQSVIDVVRDTTAKPVPEIGVENRIISNACFVLRAAADEEATVAALAINLERIGPGAEKDAVEVLGLCRDPRAVEVRCHG